MIWIQRVLTFHDRSVTAGDSSWPLTNSHAQCGVLGDSVLAVVYDISHIGWVKYGGRCEEEKEDSDFNNHHSLLRFTKKNGYWHAMGEVFE